MRKFERTTSIKTWRDFVREDIEKGGNSYYVMIDLRDRNIVLMSHKSKAKNYVPIGAVKTKGEKTTVRNVNKLAGQIRSAVKTSNDKSIICYSRAVSEYGRKNVTDVAFVKGADNPHYKCAAPMKLYDRNVIEFYKGN